VKSLHCRGENRGTFRGASASRPVRSAATRGGGSAGKIGGRNSRAGDSRRHQQSLPSLIWDAPPMRAPTESLEASMQRAIPQMLPAREIRAFHDRLTTAPSADDSLNTAIWEQRNQLDYLQRMLSQREMR